MMTVFDGVRRLRLQWLLARRLRNWREVWTKQQAGVAPPPLMFRSGHRLFHGTDDAPVFLFFEIFANGCYRRSVPLPHRGVVVDIGANLGAFVLDCAIRRPALTFMAYEPNRRTFERLAHNVEVNGLGARVRLFNEAVAGRAGELRMWFGGSSLESGIAPPSPDAEGLWRTVPAVTLSTVIERAGHVALLKIDAEGAEADILEDPVALQHVDAVVGEFHEALVPGTLVRLKAALAQAGLEARVSHSRRCGPMFSGHRVGAPAPRVQ
jgi:FkbM family methyltransferase